MPLLAGLRGRPWLSGAVLLVLAVSLAAPAAWFGGRRGWALSVGIGAALLLLFGAAERLWQSRSLPRRHRVDRSRFRVVSGGKSERAGSGKGNGHSQDHADGSDGPDGDKPRWVM
jgi:hypothetical protein